MRIQRGVLVVFIVLLGLNLLTWLVVYNVSKPHFLEVTFFDVGQGDSVFIEMPYGYQILIDGGPDSTVLEKLGEEMPFWDRTIDLIILTHPEHDHMAGLIEVLKRYNVKSILWTGIIRDTAEYREWQRLIGEEGSEIFIAQSGQKILAKTALIEILHPFENLEGREIKDSNNTSVVVRLVFGENSFLFTGDIYKSVERELIDGASEINSDILKAGHHGSKTSTAKEFVAEVSPDMAVISVGKDNRYGHPYQETLATLERYGILTFRTDLHGDIKIICNIKNCEIPDF